MSTVGYGDIVCVSSIGRFFMVFFILGALVRCLCLSVRLSVCPPPTLLASLFTYLFSILVTEFFLSWSFSGLFPDIILGGFTNQAADRPHGSCFWDEAFKMMLGKTQENDGTQEDF